MDGSALNSLNRGSHLGWYGRKSRSMLMDYTHGIEMGQVVGSMRLSVEYILHKK